MFGPPKETIDQTNAGGQSEILKFKKAADTDRKGYGRLLVVEFKEGVLNGFTSGSSFRNDRSTFAATNLAKIEFAKTTKEQVRELLGNPNGILRCPTRLATSVNGSVAGREIWIYKELQPVTVLRPTIRRIYNGSICEIVFDKRDLVVDMGQSSVSN